MFVLLEMNIVNDVIFFFESAREGILAKIVPIKKLLMNKILTAKTYY